jgi:hypothetical protein
MDPLFTNIGKWYLPLFDANAEDLFATDPININVEHHFIPQWKKTLNEFVNDSEYRYFTSRFAR